MHSTSNKKYDNFIKGSLGSAALTYLFLMKNGMYLTYFAFRRLPWLSAPRPVHHLQEKK
jgi:hypothetical protein